MIDFAWQQVRPQLGQLVTAIGVMAMAVALAAGMLLANRALRDSFEASIDAIAGQADLRVTATSGGTMDEEVIQIVRSSPGVGVAAPLLVERLFLSSEESAAVRLVGVDMLDDATIRAYGSGGSAADVIDDPLVFLAQPDSAMAPEAFLAAHGLRLGDTVDVNTPNGDVQLTVRAVLPPRGVGAAFGGSLLLMDLYSAQTALGAEGRVSQVDVRVADGHSPADVQVSLSARLPDHYAVESLDAVREKLTMAFGGFQLMLDVIASFGLILAALVTANRLTTIYERRMWEMGVVRALGTSSRQLVGDLLTESLVVSVIAAGLGLALGVVLAQLIVHPVANVTALALKHALSVSAVAPSPRPLLIAAFGGVATGVLAALVPATRVARREPAKVLAGARLRDSTPVSARRRLVTATAVLAAGGLLLLQLIVDVGALAGVTIVLVLVAACLLVEPGLRLVSQPLGDLLGSAASLGVEDQGRVPSRAMGATLVLLLGLAMVTWIASQRESFAEYVVDRLMETRQGDLVVDSAHNALATGDAQARLAEAVAVDLARVPGVEQVGVAVAARDENSGWGILAVDPIRFLDRRFGEWTLEADARPDALESVAAGTAVLIDVNLSSNSGLQVGDDVRVTSPSGAIELPIAGVIRTIPLSQQGDVVMSRELYARAWADRTFTQAYVLVQAGQLKPEVRSRIQERLGDRFQLRLLLPDELSTWFDRNVRQGFAFLDVLTALTLIVALLGSFDALAANVIERTREIGTMRALGLTGRDIAGMILAQALAIGLVGAVLGVLAGGLMTFAFVNGLLPGVVGWRLEFHLRADVAIVSAGLGILACLIGAVIPAVRASKLVPATALRSD